MQLILIRHGETSWNKEGRIQGISDIELSEAGIKQARLLALSLKDQPIDAIHASPLKRALKTAELINEYHRKEIQTHSDLMEMDQGDFEGYSFKELMSCEKDFLNKWIADPASVQMPNGESLNQLQTRAWRTLETILQYVKGLTPLQTGLVLMAQPVVMGALSPVAGRLSDRIEPAVLASAGMALTTLGLALLGFLDAAAPLAPIVAVLLLIGAGFALFSSPNTNAIMASVERRHRARPRQYRRSHTRRFWPARPGRRACRGYSRPGSGE